MGFRSINLMGLYNKEYQGGAEHYITSERECSVRKPYVEKFTVAEARSGRRLPFTGKKGRDPARRAPNGIGCLGPKASNGIACRPNSASWATRGRARDVTVYRPRDKSCSWGEDCPSLRSLEGQGCISKNWVGL